MDAGINLEVKYLKGYYIRTVSGSGDTLRHIEKLFAKLHPSITIGYTISTQQSIKLRLAQSANFPEFEQLLDFVYKGDLFKWQSGNPGLKPSDLYSAYLGYTFIKPKWYLSTDVYYSYNHNMSAVVPIPVSSTIWLNKPFNIAQKSSIGLNNSFWMRIKRFDWTVYSDLSAVDYHIIVPNTLSLADYNPYPSANKLRLKYLIYSQISYNKGKFNIGSSINYSSQLANYDGYSSGNVNAGINVSYSLIDDKLQIGASAKNLLARLNNNNMYSSAFGIVTESWLYGISYKPMFGLNLKYNFKQGDRGTENIKGKR